MKTARGLSLLLLFCVLQLSQSVAFDPANYDFLNATSKPYCIHNVLSQQEMQEQVQIATARIDQLNASYPNMNTHLVSAIIYLCNRKSERFMKMLERVINYTLQFSTPFMLALVLLICMFVAWIYSIFWKSSRKTSNKSFGYEFSNETQIALAVFVISLFFVVSIATYGISTSGNISRSINEIWCSLLKQDHGYIIGEKDRGRMVDYALELNKFTEALTQRYEKIQLTLQDLKRQKIITKDNQLAVNTILQGNSSLVLAASSIGTTFNRIHEELIYFNDTLEYERQVMIGFSILFGNADKYGERYIGFQNISTLFQRGTQLLLAAVTLTSIFSICAIAFIVLRERLQKIYLKYILQYLLGGLCACCLFAAIFNSFYMMLGHTGRYVKQYMLNPANTKNEFLIDGTLKDPLVEIMVSFFPKGSGNLTQYGNGTLLKDFTLLKQQIEDMNSIALSSTEKEVDIYRKSLELIGKEVEEIRTDMISTRGLGKLDPRAHGRFYQAFLDAVFLCNFNLAYEYRLLFGYAAFFIIISLISSIFISFHYKVYVKTSQIDSQGSFEMVARSRKGSHEFLEKSPGEE